MLVEQVHEVAVSVIGLFRRMGGWLMVSLGVTRPWWGVT